MDNWLPGILRIAFGAEDPKTAFEGTLAALTGEAAEPSEQDPQSAEPAGDAEPGLTAIEEEVSRLLAEAAHDSEPQPPAQPS
jgi:hypothetical protein